MKYPCEIIRDLLPLYMDGACSKASTQMVEEHLSECGECTTLLDAMKSNPYDKALQLEKEDVIFRHTRNQNRKALAAGTTVAGILCIPILVCLIVNLAVGHALDWFFIVLTSILVLASLLVVPLIVGQKKGLYTLFCFAGSLLLLLFTCAVYTDGTWFFVAGSSVLFGLSVLFAPYLSFTLPLPAFWNRNKGLFIFTTDSILLAVMLFCIGFYVNNQTYWSLMPPIVLFNAGFLWILFLICRYLKLSSWFRAGIATITAGWYIFIVDQVIARILGETHSWPRFYLNLWNPSTADGNIKWLILIGSMFIGILCIGIGIAQRTKKK